MNNFEDQGSTNTNHKQNSLECICTFRLEEEKKFVKFVGVTYTLIVGMTKLVTQLCTSLLSLLLYSPQPCLAYVSEDHLFISYTPCIRIR